MFPVVGIGAKYSIGKMAEVIIACNEMITNVQKEVENASHDILDAENIAKLCKSSSSTCFRNYQTNEIRKKAFLTNQTTSLPKPKTIQDPRFKELYKRLMDLEDAGRMEWLEVFMYMSSYMKVLRPIGRAEWDRPKKFVQRQTLVLDGPYPGISNDLIIANKVPASRFEKMGKGIKQSPMGSAAHCQSMTVKKMELKRLDKRKPSRTDQKILCSCIDVVRRSPSSRSESRNKHLFDNSIPEHLENYNYCMA